MKIPRILFRCDGNQVKGLGHLTRCASLARHLLSEAPDAQVVFWGSYDTFARNLLTRYGLPTLSIAVPPSDVTGLSATLTVCANFDVLLLDSYNLNQGYIDGLKQQSCRLALIDDEQCHDLSSVDLVICFRAGAETMDYSAHRQLLGPTFMLVKPELRPLRERNLELAAERTISRVLVFLSGGYLGHELLPRVLASLDIFGLEVSYLSSHLIHTSAFTHIALTPDIETAYANTDFVICGGGLTKYECAYAGIPNACLSLTGLQSEDTQIMAARGFTLDLGLASELKSRHLREQVIDFINNPAALAAQRQAFASKLDGSGPNQVAKTLLSL